MEVSEKRKHWKWTISAALANYLDSGSIVSGASALTLWTAQFHLSNTTVGLLGAISSNAISAGVGALIGGRICDKFGRKKIYAYDLLVYIIGMFILVCAVKPWMLFLGYIVAGLAVGADIPASWTLIAEQAPADSRGKHGGLAQALWSLGPVCTLALSFILTPLGIWGARIVFLHLIVIAFITWLMRHDMSESETWEEEQKKLKNIDKSEKVSVSSLFKGQNLKSIIFLVAMYGLWNLVAGTGGFFLPYILQNFGSQSQATSVGLQCLEFAISVFTTVTIFMRFSDSSKGRKWTFFIGAIVNVTSMALFAFFKLNFVISLSYVILWGIGQGMAQQPFFQLWSSELFPTRFRSTAQGIMFSIVRIGLGFWSFFVPTLATLGFQGLALTMTAFLLVSMIVGIVFAPKTSGKSLKQIEKEMNMSI
ncbi:MFS transporter [Clostridium sp. AWRP]|uniref:MFS transporter n=1 Tax=Clostridium sp. AWRP TaxID=2212991 RepID=UPI000FD9646A|nr:MFS transporter [Clostridium sp. AWRP]AZV58926.1 MFS transporter [Clostridium sp. AWRP]